MFKVFAIPSGFAVSFVRPDGVATAHTECGTRKGAQEVADYLNRKRREEAKAQELRDIANAHRRSVRRFLADPYA